MWWIGDWANYGERQYGDIRGAADALGYERGSFWDAKWVASSVKTSSRGEVLSWGHHHPKHLLTSIEWGLGNYVLEAQVNCEPATFASLSQSCGNNLKKYQTCQARNHIFREDNLPTLPAYTTVFSPGSRPMMGTPSRNASSITIGKTS